MDRKKRIIASTASLAVTVLLVGGLFLAVPTATATSTATSPAGVTALSTTSFEFTFQVKVGAGEHIPDDFAFFDVRAAGGASLCTPETDATTGAKVVIKKTGGPATVSAKFFGYKSTSTAYLFTATTGQGLGPGTHYFKATVTGCAALDAHLGTDATGRIEVSGGIGESKVALKHVTIAQKTFTINNLDFKPAKADPTIEAGGAEDDVDSEGDTTTVTFTDKDATKGRAIKSGETVSADTGASTGATKISAKVKTDLANSDKPDDDEGNALDAIPSGTSISITTSDDPEAFGADEDDIDEEADGDSFLNIRIEANVPGKGDVDPADYFDFIDVTIKLPKNDFDNLDEAERFKLIGFDDEGDRKSSDPVKQSGPSSSGSNYVWVFRISDFSSFNGIVTPVSALDGEFDNTEDTSIIRIGNVNKLTWTSCGSDTLGYQIWREDGASWEFRAETAADVLTYNDEGPAGADYKVTCFEDHTLAGGWIDVDSTSDPSDIPGWDNDTTVDDQGVSSDQTSDDSNWNWALAVAVIALICGALTVVVFAIVRAAR